MNFSLERIPQLPEVNKVLERHTGWNVVPVKALIPFTEFFALLASKKFPVATFIRSRARQARDAARASDGPH
jgi:phenylalanine-4-hydroxylase